MSGVWMRTGAVMMLGGAMLAGGCKSAPAPATATQPVLNSDGTATNANGSVTAPPGTAPAQQQQAAPQPMAVRNPDGSITNPDGSVTYPPGSKVASREQAVNGPLAAPPTSVLSSAPAAAPAPVRLTVPAGATVVVRLNTGLAASRNEVGDRFTGVLDAALMSHGEVVFARGTPVSGEVESSKGKGRFKGAGDLGISLTDIGRERVETSVYEKNSPGRGKRTAGFVGGGAGLGALIGGIAGGGKGALIGGLAGAGGGTAAGAYTGDRDVVIPAESRVTFRLTQSVTK